MDPEAMYDDIANVGVKEGRIAAITKARIQGKETIDAAGLLVGPRGRPAGTLAMLIFAL
jgi:N-acyl-D-glutamate deacylase